MPTLFEPKVHLERIFAYVRDIEKNSDSTPTQKYYELIGYIDAQSGFEVLSKEEKDHGRNNN